MAQEVTDNQKAIVVRFYKDYLHKPFTGKNRVQCVEIDIPNDSDEDIKSLRRLCVRADRIHIDKFNSNLMYIYLKPSLSLKTRRFIPVKFGMNGDVLSFKVQYEYMKSEQIKETHNSAYRRYVDKRKERYGIVDEKETLSIEDMMEEINNFDDDDSLVKSLSANIDEEMNEVTEN